MEVYAFADCSGLKTLEIEEGDLTVIPQNAFSGCSSLTSVAIPKNIATVNSYAFQDCTKLEGITFYNPECKIYDNKSTICNDSKGFTGTIYGYKDSTAQAYAEKYGYKFAEIGEQPTTSTPSKAELFGDANGDGEISLSDAVFIMQSLSNPDEYQLNEQQILNADVVDAGSGLTTMDALAIQMIGINLISIEDLPMTSEEIANITQ